MQSKNPTSGVQLKPSHSRFSKHDHSTMQDEAIKVDETAASEFGSEKSYIAGLLEYDEEWHKTMTFNWIKGFSNSQESLNEARLLT